MSSDKNVSLVPSPHKLELSQPSKTSGDSVYVDYDSEQVKNGRTKCKKCGKYYHGHKVSRDNRSSHINNHPSITVGIGHDSHHKKQHAIDKQNIIIHKNNEKQNINTIIDDTAQENKVNSDEFGNVNEIVIARENNALESIKSIEININNTNIDNTSDVSETLAINLPVSRRGNVKIQNHRPHDIGNHTQLSDFKIGRTLGKGGFADVYLCKHKNGNKYALKKIMAKPQRGIPCLMEASIMASYKHPSLACSVFTASMPDAIYIIQKLAICDLNRWRKKMKQRPELRKLKHITWQIVTAISFLHREGIIHGDIKASNVLLYNDNNLKVRICDFNLSSYKKWNSNLNVCTATHRPLEVWRGDRWTEKIDIWSLGCTMFELYYGYSLIPYQGDIVRKKEKKERYINAIIDWISLGYNRRSDKNKSIPRKYDISYTYPDIPSSLKKHSSSPYVRMMQKILRGEPNDRPNINDILNSSFYNSKQVDLRDGMTKSYVSTTTTKNKKIENDRLRNRIPINIQFVSKHRKIDSDTIDKHELLKIMRKLTYYTDDDEVQRLASKIYIRYCMKTKYKTNNNTIISSIWVARKLIRKVSYDIQVPNHNDNEMKNNIMKEERRISEVLNYKLHL
uniref:non-specific serine/threonine protein kinase n=1 Tax=Pithovirus LCPAC101 TaxID=2506586 RepID=A0A481Z1Z7_9VIRU|nr:MAG: putative serine/threonine protein kinase [Pithovirus LCPAC101]